MTNEYLRVFRAFTDKNRIQILELLCGGEQCACILLDSLKISQHRRMYLCQPPSNPDRAEAAGLYCKILKGTVQASILDSQKAYSKTGSMPSEFVLRTYRHKIIYKTSNGPYKPREEHCGTFKNSICPTAAPEGFYGTK